MRYLVILILFLSSCSIQERATWHLTRAVTLDPDIIDIQADTTIENRKSYIDSTYYFQLHRLIKLRSDTARAKDSIVNGKLKNDTLKTNSDGVNIAGWIKDNELFLAGYYKKDTTVTVRDTQTVYIPYFYETQTIKEERAATITETESLWSRIQNSFTTILWIAGGVILIILILKIIKLL